MKAVGISLIAVLVAGCGTMVVEPLDEARSAVISDDAHGGVRRGFFFLPPMVAQPTWSGVFDPSLVPTVLIRDLGSHAVVSDLSADVRVDEAGEQYAVNWKTGGLDPARTYRIEVGLPSGLIGFADVDVVSSGRELRNVDTGEYIPLLDGRTLPIKFRMEAGIRCVTDPCILRVPQDAPTIQAAVDRVGDGGLVELAPGTYTESVEISGKWVHLLGDPQSGRLSAELVQPRPMASPRDVRSAHGVVDFRTRGGGRLENLAIVGGDGGVLGHGGTRALGELSLANVELHGNAYGIAGSWPKLDAMHIVIDAAVVNAYQSCGGNHDFIDALVTNSEGMGFFVASCESHATFVLTNANVNGNQKGGIAAVGDVGISVTSTTMIANRAFGVFLHGVPSSVFMNDTIALTAPGTLQGQDVTYEDVQYGFIAASGASTSIIGMQNFDNGRAGLFFDEASSGTFTDSISAGSKIGAEFLQGSSMEVFGNSSITGTEQNIVIDGPLPVPEPPPVPQE